MATLTRLAILLMTLLPIERGPWLLIGRIPDRNPYTCAESSSGTYVGPAASITDSTCAVWVFGSGVSPNTLILRNGAQSGGNGAGSLIEYYQGIVYAKGVDANWYIWDYALLSWSVFGSTDPSMSVTPIGYFVSTTGSDSNTCTQSLSSAAPKRNFNGVNGAIACLSAGNTLYARGGTYAEALLGGVPSGTSWLNTVRIAAYPGETVWLTPASGNYVAFFNNAEHYIEFDGINLDARSTSGPDVVFMPTGGASHHIRMQNAEIIGSPFAGFCANICGGESSEWINLVIHGGAESNAGCGTPCANYGFYTGGSNNTFQDSEIYDVVMEGIQIYNGGGGVPTNNTIRNNRIHDITRSGDTNPGARFSGVLITGVNNLLYNNVIWNVGRSDGNSSNAGITIFGGSSSARIMNNTVYSVFAYGISVESGGPSGTFVQNNVVYLSGAAGLNDAGASTTKNNNMVSGVNPLFAAAGGGNFRLTASSPGRDTGTALTSFFTTDLESIPRPQGPLWDIGAYEYH